MKQTFQTQTFFFLLSSDIHSYSGRSQKNFSLPLCCTSSHTFFINFLCPQLWNSPDRSLKLLSSYKMFRSGLATSPDRLKLICNFIDFLFVLLIILFFLSSFSLFGVFLFIVSFRFSCFPFFLFYWLICFL